MAFTFAARWSIVLLFILLFAATTAALLALPIRHTPERFQVCWVQALVCMWIPVLF